MSPYSATSPPLKCDRCGSEIPADEARRHRSEVLCENCAMDALMPRTRKTHWQYVWSVKSEYLREDVEE